MCISTKKSLSHSFSLPHPFILHKGRSGEQQEAWRPASKALALPKTAPALALQMERLLWWSWSRFRKCLAKQLHLLD